MQVDSEERASSKMGDLFLEVDGAIDVGLEAEPAPAPAPARVLWATVEITRRKDFPIRQPFPFLSSQGWQKMLRYRVPTVMLGHSNLALAFTRHISGRP
jgi:hypothetical protein